MKQLIPFIFIIFLLASCGSSTNETSSDKLDMSPVVEKKYSTQEIKDFLILAERGWLRAGGENYKLSFFGNGEYMLEDTDSKPKTSMGNWDVQEDELILNNTDLGTQETYKIVIRDPDLYLDEVLFTEIKK
ncbi:MAG: hypothetical protein PHH30_09410 [Bacteroidales bacterium]|nr:hypothetical protein [Bacteroidales bacterium]